MSEAGIQIRNTNSGEAMAFDGITVTSHVTGALAKTSLQQHYCNRGDEPIEIVYEFPLPLNGVLLKLTITVGEKVMQGVVSARANAEREYEEAITEGNSAFLLRELRDGLYQINIGNLLPQEQCTIAIDYAEVLAAQDDALRYRLPTVVAPHYGNQANVGLTPQDAPKTNFMAEHGMHITVHIHGMDGAELTAKSPTHKLQQRIENGVSVVELDTGSRKNFMDRDFILLIPQARRDSLTVWQQPQENGVAVLGLLSTAASLGAASSAPLQLTVVVDCSGSMTGDSIAQARAALMEIIDRLDEKDHLSVLRFGSTQDVWTSKPLEMTASAKQALVARIMHLEADLGGTEILPALKKSLQMTPAEGQILLITDGESYVSDQDIAAIAKSGRRFFTVGVGSSVSEMIVRNLAEQSRGYCELVSPNEAMKGRIVQQVYRMRQPMANLAVQWGEHKPQHSMIPDTVFLGDAVLFSAILHGMPVQSVTTTITAGNLSHSLQAQATAAPDMIGADLARIVTWQQLPALSEEEATQLAVQHQLVTKWTSMSAVLERDATTQTNGMPALVKVEQMMPAGWGGTSALTVCGIASYLSEPCFPVSRSADYLDIQAFALFDQSSASLTFGRKNTKEATPSELLACIENEPLPTDLELREHIEECLNDNCKRLPLELLNSLMEIMEEELDAQSIDKQLNILYAALIDFLLTDVFKAGVREHRGVRKLLQQSNIDGEILLQVKPYIAKVLSGTTKHSWPKIAVM